MSKKLVEALIFASNGITREEILEKVGINRVELEKIIKELKEEYAGRGFRLFDDGNVLKFVIAEEIVDKVEAEPELPEGVVRTLAVIAFNAPITQAKVVEIRGNKAYEHIKKLIKEGFVKAERKGQTLLLDVTQKFFDYFNVSPHEFLKIRKNIY